MQENLAEEMIKLAQNLKHSSVTARNIIKEDNKVRSVLQENCVGLQWVRSVELRELKVEANTEYERLGGFCGYVLHHQP